MLTETVENILYCNGYEYCRYSGCFDIAAKGKDLLLLKVLVNIDSLCKSHSENLKALSNALNARAVVISDHTNRESLSDGIVYERFSLPVITARTLETTLSGGFPKHYRKRGGMFTDIDRNALKSARIAKRMTQEHLAKRVGITKKCIYEHENSYKKMRLEHVQCLKQVLGVDISIPADMQQNYSTTIESNDIFERAAIEGLEAMGFSADTVYQSPFNIVVHDKKMLILLEAGENILHVEKKIPYIMKFSSLINVPAIAITKDETGLEIPTIKEEDLRYLRKRDIKRMVK